jgi:IS5 family transposase
MRQITFANQPGFEKYARKSRREEFLNVMEVVVPWRELEALIEPHYPKAGGGRQPVGLSIMLRVCLLQQWFSLSDPGAEDALYESPVLRSFVGVDLGQAPLHLTKRRSFASAICWKNMSCAARFWTR